MNVCCTLRHKTHYLQFQMYVVEYTILPSVQSVWTSVKNLANDHNTSLSTKSKFNTQYVIVIVLDISTIRLLTHSEAPSATDRASTLLVSWSLSLHCCNTNSMLPCATPYHAPQWALRVMVSLSVRWSILKWHACITEIFITLIGWLSTVAPTVDQLLKAI